MWDRDFFPIIIIIIIMVIIIIIIIIIIYLFIHVHVIYSRFHNGPWDMEQVKISIVQMWYMCQWKIKYNI
jgi:hypothetical protein